MALCHTIELQKLKSVQKKTTKIISQISSSIYIHIQVFGGSHEYTDKKENILNSIVLIITYVSIDETFVLNLLRFLS